MALKKSVDVEEVEVIDAITVDNTTKFIVQATERGENIEGVTKVLFVPIKLNNEDGHPDQVFGKLEIQFPRGHFPFGLYEVAIKQIQ